MIVPALPSIAMGGAMRSDFQINEFAGLSIQDQIRKCRAMAVEAKNFAATADRDMSDVYLDLANRWEALADEMYGSQDARHLVF
jgi:hypothetical protein